MERDRDIADRVKAAGSEGAVSLLQVLREDERPWARAKAAVLLGELYESLGDGKEIMDALMGAARSDKSILVRSVIARGVLEPIAYRTQSWDPADAGRMRQAARAADINPWSKEGAFRILDVGAQFGEATYEMAKYYRERGRNVQVAGLDRTVSAVIEAERNRKDGDVVFLLADAHRHPLDSADVVISMNLHLTGPELYGSETELALEKSALEKHAESLVKLAKADGGAIYYSPSNMSPGEDGIAHLDFVHGVLSDVLRKEAPGAKVERILTSASGDIFGFKGGAFKSPWGESSGWVTVRMPSPAKSAGPSASDGSSPAPDLPATTPSSPRARSWLARIQAMALRGKAMILPLFLKTFLTPASLLVPAPADVFTAGVPAQTGQAAQLPLDVQELLAKRVEIQVNQVATAARFSVELARSPEIRGSSRPMAILMAFIAPSMTVAPAGNGAFAFRVGQSFLLPASGAGGSVFSQRLAGLRIQQKAASLDAIEVLFLGGRFVSLELADKALFVARHPGGALQESAGLVVAVLVVIAGTFGKSGKTPRAGEFARTFETIEDILGEEAPSAREEAGEARPASAANRLVQALDDRAASAPSPLIIVPVFYLSSYLPVAQATADQGKGVRLVVVTNSRDILSPKEAEKMLAGYKGRFNVFDVDMKGRKFSMGSLWSQIVDQDLQTHPLTLVGEQKFWDFEGFKKLGGVVTILHIAVKPGSFIARMVDQFVESTTPLTGRERELMASDAQNSDFARSEEIIQEFNIYELQY